MALFPWAGNSLAGIPVDIICLQRQRVIGYVCSSVAMAGSHAGHYTGALLALTMFPMCIADTWSLSPPSLSLLSWCLNGSADLLFRQAQVFNFVCPAHQFPAWIPTWRGKLVTESTTIRGGEMSTGSCGSFSSGSVLVHLVFPTIGTGRWSTHFLLSYTSFALSFLA